MKHLLSISDLSKSEAITILNTAEELARASDGPMKKLPALRGRTIVNLFAEDSTRTRISFEAAAKRLSADVINFSAKGSSVSKGESLKDTAQTLQAMGADAVIIRHSASGAAARLADNQWMSGSVINAGDGTHEHPSQALLDAFTIRRVTAWAPCRVPQGRCRGGLSRLAERPSMPGRRCCWSGAARPVRRCAALCSTKRNRGTSLFLLNAEQAQLQRVRHTLLEHLGYPCGKATDYKCVILGGVAAALCCGKAACMGLHAFVVTVHHVFARVQPA